METRKWHFGNNYELYNILYDDTHFILVQNINNKLFSFGLTEDFGSFLGFPVNQSCLNKNECINTLNKIIEIGKKYNNINKTINIYKTMIELLESKEV